MIIEGNDNYHLPGVGGLVGPEKRGISSVFANRSVVVGELTTRRSTTLYVDALHGTDKGTFPNHTTLH